MLLHGDARGADAAIWRRSDVGPPDAHFQRVPPLLAIEVAADEDEAALREKARWYLGAGVQVAWIILPGLLTSRGPGVPEVLLTS
jgi:Uma2 family endonuclease